jgi:DNA polymerase III sliding clamp (beta) subunit (PCNA family)
VPSEITFPNIELKEAVEKASRVAPTKGAAFDKAAGIQISAFPSRREAIIRATDTEVTFRQKIYATGAQGDDAVWRIPSGVLADFCATLKTGEQDSTTFIDRGADDRIRLKADRTLAAYNTLDAATYPLEGELPQFDMIPADVLSTRVEQVSWACDSKHAAMKGVYLDGDNIYGVNPYSMAVVPCKVALPEPIIAPLDQLKMILKSSSDVRIGSTGNRLWIHMDDEAVASTLLIEERFPNARQLLRDDFMGVITLHKITALECMQRLAALVKVERLPAIEMRLDAGTLTPTLVFDMSVAQHGRMATDMDVVTEYDQPFSIRFVPAMIQRAIEHAKGDTVEMWFGKAGDPDKNETSAVTIRDKSGYQCVVMPKVQ